MTTLNTQQRLPSLRRRDFVSAPILAPYAVKYDKSGEYAAKFDLKNEDECVGIVSNFINDSAGFEKSKWHCDYLAEICFAIMENPRFSAALERKGFKDPVNTILNKYSSLKMEIGYSRISYVLSAIIGLGFIPLTFWVFSQTGFHFPSSLPFIVLLCFFCSIISSPYYTPYKIQADQRGITGLFIYGEKFISYDSIRSVRRSSSILRYLLLNFIIVENPNGIMLLPFSIYDGNRAKGKRAQATILVTCLKKYLSVDKFSDDIDDPQAKKRSLVVLVIFMALWAASKLFPLH